MTTLIDVRYQTHGQRMTALNRANDARHGPVEFRRAMAQLARRDALLYAARMLREDPACVASMRCYKFLEAVPRIGWVQAQKILTRNHIYAAKPMNALTERQERILAGELESLARRVGVGR